MTAGLRVHFHELALTGYSEHIEQAFADLASFDFVSPQAVA